MTKEFDLGVILTVISDVNLVNDFSSVSDLFTFVYGVSMDPFMLKEMRGHLTTHILGLHPELGEIDYRKVFFGLVNIDTWVNDQKAKFGESLKLCPVGMGLNDAPGIIK